MVNPLLAKIPQVKIPLNQFVLHHYRIHSLIVASLTLGFAAWFTKMQTARFPITFGGSIQEDYYCVPDYATGKVLTYTRSKLRYIDYV